MTTEIFVFGSNEGGIHGAGAARTAFEKFGAEMGCGYGHMGKSFAIPTKDRFIQRTLLLTEIQIYVNAFLLYAVHRPDLEFQITRIGCGLAGHNDADIAPMFFNAPNNCQFDLMWRDYLGPSHIYWGTF